MLYQKVFYLIEVVDKTCLKCYGKNSFVIPVNSNNTESYIKKYGFDTAYDAYKELEKLSKLYSKNNWEYIGMQVTEKKIFFKNYEEYLEFKESLK